MQSGAYRQVMLGTFIAISVVVNLLESLFIGSLGVPGARLGLANVLTLLVLVTFGFREGFIVTVCRAVFTSLLYGYFMRLGFFMSLGAGIASLIGMHLGLVFFKSGLGLVGVSVIGSALNNAAQLLVFAISVRDSAVFYYMPYLLIISIPTGIFVGLSATAVSRAKLYRRLFHNGRLVD